MSAALVCPRKVTPHPQDTGFWFLVCFFAVSSEFFLPPLPMSDVALFSLAMWTFTRNV
jgi:hypothetical protein